MSSSTTHDLRSHAKDFGRVKAHNSKWANGSRPGAGLSCRHNVLPGLTCIECAKRPVRDTSRNLTSLKQAESKRETSRNHTMARKIFRNDVTEGVYDAHDDLSDSSADFEVDDASAAPEASEIMYSFDAPTGPCHGNEVLSYAINQAVQRFENNETDKIVKKEYDLVLDGKDDFDSYVADVDDDFELIDGTHLH